MKRLLKRLLFFAVPIFIFIAVVEYLLRNIPNDYSLKADIYKTRGSEFETLILGSSYAFYDLDPSCFDTKTFNGGHLAQSLDIDAAIFHRFEQGLVHLKYVIIPISNISFFFRLGNSNENWRIADYSIYYKLHPSFRVSDYLKILSLPFSMNRNKLISYYVRKQSIVTSSDNGFGTNYKSGGNQNLDTSAIRAGIVHKVASFKNFSIEKESLEEIVEMCEKKNIKVILVTPPFYKSYVSNIDSLQLKVTLNTCNYFKEKYKNVHYFSLLTDTSFHDSDYYDAVHLNESGAKKMSAIVNEYINALGDKK